jgi:hypothetical protein
MGRGRPWAPPTLLVGRGRPWALPILLVGRRRPRARPILLVGRRRLPVVPVHFRLVRRFRFRLARRYCPPADPACALAFWSAAGPADSAGAVPPDGPVGPASPTGPDSGDVVTNDVAGVVADDVADVVTNDVAAGALLATTLTVTIEVFVAIPPIELKEIVPPVADPELLAAVWTVMAVSNCPTVTVG